MSGESPEYVPPFTVGQRVRIRAEFRRDGDFTEAVVREIDAADWTVDVDVDGKDWGQWFCRLPDGTYEIEAIPEQNDRS